MCTSTTGTATAAIASRKDHRGVGIATSIEDDTIVEAISTLNGIDKLALDIRLIVVERNRRVTCAKSSEVVLEALTSVYLGLATSQKVEIRPVDNQNFHRKIGLVR